MNGLGVHAFIENRDDGIGREDSLALSGDVGDDFRCD